MLNKLLFAGFITLTASLPIMSKAFAAPNYSISLNDCGKDASYITQQLTDQGFVVLFVINDEFVKDAKHSFLMNKKTGEVAMVSQQAAEICLDYIGKDVDLDGKYGDFRDFLNLTQLRDKAKKDS